MVLTIYYPGNSAEWYAKGNFEDGTYFEVPAVFNPDGSCDELSTKERVEQFYVHLNARP